jgi:sugar lactone lactonase YvrE
VTRDGSVYASDQSSAVAEVLPDGSIRRIGDAGGQPNGIALTADGKFLIANFGTGLLQLLDPRTEELEIVAQAEANGHSLKWLNFPVIDSTGGIWASVCSADPDLSKSLSLGIADGFLLRLDELHGRPHIAVDNVNFPNCMTLDWDERYLYVVRTSVADVVRFPVHDGRLGTEELYSPPLGDRRGDEYGTHASALMRKPDVARRWGMADGCGFDAEGNLWVTLVGAHKIVAITPDREVVTVAEDPEGRLINSPTSIAWGGEDLRDVYIGSLASPYIVKGRSSVAGMLMIHQR